MDMRGRGETVEVVVVLVTHRITYPCRTQRCDRVRRRRVHVTCTDGNYALMCLRKKKLFFCSFADKIKHDVCENKALHLAFD